MVLFDRHLLTIETRNIKKYIIAVKCESYMHEIDIECIVSMILLKTHY